MIVGRTERVFASFPITVTDADGAPVEVATVGLALLTPRRTPDADTTWTDAPVTATEDGPVVTALYAGPDADTTGALAVPVGGADLWVRNVDSPEIATARVERLTVS